MGAKSLSVEILDVLEAESMKDIQPNFGVQYFKTKDEAAEYLKRLGFRLVLTRSDYDVYETVEQPQKRATLYQHKNGQYLVGQHVAK